MLKKSVVLVRLDRKENLNNPIRRAVQEPAIPASLFDARSVLLVALIVVEGNVAREAEFAVLPILNVSDNARGKLFPLKKIDEGTKVFA